MYSIIYLSITFYTEKLNHPMGERRESHIVKSNTRTSNSLFIRTKKVSFITFQTIWHKYFFTLWRTDVDKHYKTFTQSFILSIGTRYTKIFLRRPIKQLIYKKKKKMQLIFESHSIYWLVCILWQCFLSFSFLFGTP